MERSGQRRQQVALDEGGFGSSKQPLGVVAGDEQGVAGDVAADQIDSAPVPGQRDADCAGACSDIGDLRGAEPRLADVVEGGVDEEFRFGSGDEDVGRDAELEPVELACAGDVGEGLAGCALGDCRFEALLRGRVDFVGQRGVELSTIEAGGVSEQDFSFEAGVVDLGRLQFGGGGQPGVSEHGGSRHCDASASRRGLLGGRGGVDQRIEVAFEHAVEVVPGEPDSMIGDAVFGVVIGADLSQSDRRSRPGSGGSRRARARRRCAAARRGGRGARTSP